MPYGPEEYWGQLWWRAYYFLGSWSPIVYGAVLAGISLWLVRRTRLPGSLWLAAGWGTGTILLLAARVLSAVVFPRFAIIDESGSELPSRVTFAIHTLGMVRLAAMVIVAIGFWKLCSHLVAVMALGDAGADSGSAEVSNG